MRWIWAVAILGFGASGAQAEVPRVAVDIAPVHSIVAAVMGDLGTPDLIVPPGASPHDHSMRPSEARAMDGADLIVWVGPDLTPWLQGPVDTLGTDAEILALTDVPGTLRLEVRQGAAFGAHDHGHGDEHDHSDGHDQGDDHDHSDGKSEGHDHDDGHAHNGAFDPHLWLDPQNAALWASAIATVLAGQNPENAQIYAANAAGFSDELTALEAEINASLSPVRGRPFVVFHDAYHYFEHRFGIEALGAVTANDASAASPARLSELRDAVAATGAVCALTEPQFNPGLLGALDPVRLGEIDPLGASLQPGPTLYPDMLRNMATALADCLQ
jgi:zinc transport system substrate-binding protein